MFNKTALISRQTTTKWMQVARGPKREIATPVNVSLVTIFVFAINPNKFINPTKMLSESQASSGQS